MKKTISIFFLIIFFSNISIPFTYAGTENFGIPKVNIPETIGEAKDIGKKLNEEAQKRLPEIIKNIFFEEVTPIFNKTVLVFKTSIFPEIRQWIDSLIGIEFKKEIEKRKPTIKEEFKKEQEEIKKNLPVITKRIWERFKLLIK